MIEMYSLINEKKISRDQEKYSISSPKGIFKKQKVK